MIGLGAVAVGSVYTGLRVQNECPDALREQGLPVEFLPSVHARRPGIIITTGERSAPSGKRKYALYSWPSALNENPLGADRRRCCDQNDGGHGKAIHCGCLLNLWGM